MCVSTYMWIRTCTIWSLYIHWIQHSYSVESFKKAYYITKNVYPFSLIHLLKTIFKEFLQVVILIYLELMNYPLSDAIEGSEDSLKKSIVSNWILKQFRDVQFGCTGWSAHLREGRQRGQSSCPPGALGCCEWKPAPLLPVHSLYMSDCWIITFPPQHWINALIWRPDPFSLQLRKAQREGEWGVYGGAIVGGLCSCNREVNSRSGLLWWARLAATQRPTSLQIVCMLQWPSYQNFFQAINYYIWT